MITQTTCPACQFKLSVPEAEMGKRQVCPNCKSPFIAGASVPEPLFARNQPAAPAPTYQKTMLGDTSPAIKYNCPRCKVALEAPTIEAGTKKPCPACGQRLQVPAAPPPPAPAPAAAPQPSLVNKTMLADDASAPVAPPIKYNCPACKKPLESPASEALMKKPCPACGQRIQVPAAPPAPKLPNPNRTMLATDANGPQPIGGQPAYGTPVAPIPVSGAPAAAPAPTGSQIAIGPYKVSTRNFWIGVVVGVLLLLFFGQAIVRGGRADDPAAALALQKEIQKANEELEQKRAKIEDHNKFVADILARLARQEDTMRDNHREQLRNIGDAKERAAMQDRQDREKAKFEQDKRDTEAKLNEELAKLKADAAAAAQKQQQVIIQQPAPVYYPPYHWRYYSPWGW